MKQKTILMMLLAIGLLVMFLMPKVEAADGKYAAWHGTQNNMTVFAQRAYGLTVTNGSVTNRSTLYVEMKRVGTDADVYFNSTLLYSYAGTTAPGTCAGSGITWTYVTTNTSYVNTSGNISMTWTVPAIDGFYCYNVSTNGTTSTGAQIAALTSTSDISVVGLLELDDTPPTVASNFTNTLFETSDTLRVYTDDSASVCFFGYNDSSDSAQFNNAFTTSSVLNPYVTITNISGGQRIYFLCRDDHYNWETTRHMVRTFGEEDEPTGGVGDIINQAYITQHRRQYTAAVVGIVLLIGIVLVGMMGKKRRR